MLRVTLLVVFVWAVTGCQQQKKTLSSVGQRSDTSKSIEVGELFTLYELPFAYDHTIIFNPKDKKWHLYGIMSPSVKFIHLTADSLTQRGWHKAEPFEYKGREIWAPHIVFHDDLYYMFYTSIGSPREIRYATSPDLYNWTHPSTEPLFAYANDANPNLKNKDPMVFRHEDQWIMYYSMMKDDKHWVVGYSTSKDLVNWDGPKICFDEHTESPGVESPFVVKRGDYYYLTLSARPWPHGAQEFFRSKSPFKWKVSDKVKSIFPWHAAEVVRDLDGKWYLSRSSGDQKDFRMAEMDWNDGLDEEETSMLVPCCK